MENGTPVEQIADILGHQSVESTGVYLNSRELHQTGGGNASFRWLAA
jgi:site-specific recombinase XerD